MKRKQSLSVLKKGTSARVVGLRDSHLTPRLMELGFVEGAIVELAHEAPFGGDPIAVRVRGGMIGLRRDEAEFVEVEELSDE